MKEFVYVIEIQAVKELVVKAETQKEADDICDTVMMTQDIPVRQDEITSLYVSDEYEK